MVQTTHEQHEPEIKPEWFPAIMRGIHEAYTCPVISAYDIPYLCGYPRKGVWVYKDRHAPDGYYQKDGRYVEAIKYWKIHERVEKNLQLLGLPYEIAHPIAEFMEEQMTIADDVDIDQYLKFCAIHVKEAGSDRIKLTPKLLDIQPYVDECDTKDVRDILLAMDKAQKKKKKEPVKIASSVNSNKGVETAYRKAMQQLVDEMVQSTEYWIASAYKKDPPRMEALASDAAPHTPSIKMKKTIKGLAKRWIKKFDESAPKIAEAYMRKQFEHSDKAFRQALKDAGFAVEFQMTPAMRDAFHASLAENVGLISSLPEKYYSQIEGVVMRSYTVGRDLETMTKELQKYKGITRDRAVLIARDQSNKANAVVNRARQLELGITKAIWMHSSAGKHPRPSHVAADGKEYDVSKGCLIDGEYIFPGIMINCRCTSRSVLP